MSKCINPPTLGSIACKKMKLQCSSHAFRAFNAINFTDGLKKGGKNHSSLYFRPNVLHMCLCAQDYKHMY